MDHSGREFSTCELIINIRVGPRIIETLKPLHHIKVTVSSERKNICPEVSATHQSKEMVNITKII